MKKKSIFYYFLLAEEGIAYYLTFKWPLIFFAGVISVFPTILVWWGFGMFLNFRIGWEIIFFFMWLIMLGIFLLEFRLPDTIKEKVKQKLNDVE